MRKHCRACGVHRLEIGENGKAAVFEELAVSFEDLRSKYFGGAATGFRGEQKAIDTRFSKEHKLDFQDLLAMNVELHALNHHETSLDFGPWGVFCNNCGSDLQARLRSRFRVAVRKAAIAAGAPARANLLDWWISKLARGKRHHYIQGLIQLSVEFCAELESNAMELKPLIGETNAIQGLRRDRYECEHPVPYWLYAEPHFVLPDPSKEFAFWHSRIWTAFSDSIDEIANGRRVPRRWIDVEGTMHVAPNDQARLRVKARVERRTALLHAWILGLSYDLAVLQANYIVDRGLLGKAAVQAFELESAGLLDQVRQACSDSAKKWGLSWTKLEKNGVDFEKPFHQIGSDFRHLLFSSSLGQQREIDADLASEPELPQDNEESRKAEERQAIVMPILESKGWSRGKWASEAGVGKNSVYEYLDGKRQISPENRRAMAEVLGLEPADLPQ